MQEFSATMYRMKNMIRNYAWGSYDGLSRFAGITQDPGKPSAECWMGSHPDAPSTLLMPDGNALSLRKLIQDYPIKALGDEVFSEFGDLPFLFKALSASMPLSIQVHPDKRKAERGFAAEEAGGIPRTAPERNYRDANHKPELAVALSPFSALCGFRPLEETAGLLGPHLCEYFDFSPSMKEDALRNLLRKALGLREKDRILLENSAQERARELAGGVAGGGDGGKASLAGTTVLKCYEHYPHDPGAISPFFMSIYSLAPGQGLFIPPGVMHAYLEGTILEIMATSDNVIRGGLTHKHIDVGELLDILDFAAKPLFVEPLLAEPGHGLSGIGETVWPTPAREFRLSRIEAAGTGTVAISPEGPEILLCTEGSVSIECANANANRGNSAPTGREARITRESCGASRVRFSLPRGQSIFVSASCGEYWLNGKATVYRAGVGGSLGGSL